LGSGNSTAGQVGIYRVTRGTGLFAVGATFASHHTIAHRTAVGDQLRGTFDARSWGLRGEGGYRFAVAPRSFGVTSYGVVQF
jgi:hypothetical protein